MGFYLIERGAVHSIIVATAFVFPPEPRQTAVAIMRYGRDAICYRTMDKCVSCLAFQQEREPLVETVLEIVYWSLPTGGRRQLTRLLNLTEGEG